MESCLKAEDVKNYGRANAEYEVLVGGLLELEAIQKRIWRRPVFCSLLYSFF